MLHRLLFVTGVFLSLAAALYAQQEAKTVLFGAWGSNPGQFAHAIDGDLSGPSTFTVDSLGYIYVVDDMNDRIQQFSPEGKFVTAYSFPHYESIDDIAVALVLNLNRAVRGRTIYTADLAGYGFSQERLLVGRVEKDAVKPLKLQAPPIMISRIATDSRHRLFVEARGDKDSTSSVWLFDGNLRYRGHRDISDICIQSGSDSLIGISHRRTLGEKPDNQRWTLQILSAVDMQYPVLKSVEIDVPVKPMTPSKLLGVDSSGNFYVLALSDKTPEGNQWKIFRYGTDGINSGELDLTSYWRGSLYVEEARIGPDGAVYVATGSKEGYTIRRVMMANAE